MERADGWRNRGLLIDAAREVVGERGVDASLREIARRAGLGLGTLYRHFPTREVMLVDLFDDDIRRLTTTAARLEVIAPPEQALAHWATAVVGEVSAWRGLAAALLGAVETQTSGLRPFSSALRGAGGRLLHRAQRHGQVRAEVDQVEVFAALMGVAWVEERSGRSGSRPGPMLVSLLRGWDAQASSRLRDPGGTSGERPA